jgi:hypothetical protein
MTKKTYRVIGRKMQDYAANVDAATAAEAYDVAADLGTHEWSPLETDDVIEPIEVELTDIQLNKDMEDDWPEMGPGVIVGG